jgi:hypothetical protein
VKREDFIVEVEDTELVPRSKRPPGDKIELVRFDGTAITTNGNIVRHNWFKGLELNQARYADILLTAEEAKAIHAASSQMKLGAASATPLTCYGAEICPIANTCPFIELQRQIDARGEDRFVVPIGRKCPIEQDMLYEWVGRYAEEFGVTDEPGSYTDQRLILELAECEVLEARMNTILATKYQDLTEDKVVAVMMDKHGEREQHVKEEADALKIKERLMARKERIRKSLVATRFDQYKREAALQETSKTDTSNVHAALAAKLKKIESMVKGD